jgi:N-acetylneuraminate synthase
VQATRAIEPGEVFREGLNFDILRPGKQRLGVHPRLISRIEGSKARRRIELGDGIAESDFE